MPPPDETPQGPFANTAGVRVAAFDDPLERAAEHAIDAPSGSSRDSRSRPNLLSPLDSAATVALRSIAGPGVPLDSALRVDAERSLGADLPDVRLFRTAAPHALGTRAFAYGTGVFVSPNAPAPSTPAGRALLLHELAHVRQQQLIGQPFIQREPPPTLIASLRRMGEFVSAPGGETGGGGGVTRADLRQIPMLTVIFVVSAPHPRIFSSAELPHVHFPPYTREESIEILCKNPLPIKNLTPGEESSDDEEMTEDDKKEELYVWHKFCATVWDSLAKGAARDVVRFRTAVEKNWPTFVQPIARGEYGTRNYASLYLYHKDMFRRETSVIDTVVPPTVNERSTVVRCESGSRMRVWKGG